MLRADSELRAAPEKLLPRRRTRRRIVHTDVVHQHTTMVLAVEAAYVGTRAVRFEHDGNPVQLVVSLMKDVSGHRAQTVAPQ